MKQKTILIDQDIHDMLKSYCVKEGLVMKVLVEKLIKNHTQQNWAENGNTKKSI